MSQERKYHIWAINCKNPNERVRMTGYPMNHDKSCHLKNLMSKHPLRRLELIEETGEDLA